MAIKKTNYRRMKRAIPSTRDTQDNDCNGEFHLAIKKQIIDSKI